MRRFYIFIFLCGGTLISMAQSPVALRIDDREFSASEVEWCYLYEDTRYGSFGDFLDSYVNKQLIVQEALRMRLDTVRTYREEIKRYEHHLLFRSVLGEGAMDAISPHQQRVQVLHYTCLLPQHASRSSIRQQEIRMDSLYHSLKKKEEGAHLIDDPSISCMEEWIYPLDFPEAISRKIFALTVQEVSEPFFTPSGIHIMKVLAKDEVQVEEIRNFIHSTMQKQLVGRVEELKKQHSFVLNEEGVADLLLHGKTSHLLFTYGGQAYTGTDFMRFQQAHPYSLRKQLEHFVTRTVLYREKDRLSGEEGESRMHIRRYRDSLLSEMAMERYMTPRLQDGKQLQDYFEHHRSHYKWVLPRYRGIVLHVPEKKLLKDVKKFMKKLPEEEWEQALRLTFDGKHAPRIRFEKGEFEIGQNAYVDKLVFKQGEFTAPEGYPYTTVVGKKVTIPVHWEEVGESLLRDYRRYLETNWLKELSKKSEVEINEEVLKTVNNH